MFSNVKNSFSKILIVGIALILGCSREDSLKESKRQIRQFDYASARKTLETIVSKDSTNADALVLLLRVYSLSNDRNSADSLGRRLKTSQAPIAKLALGRLYFDSRYFDRADSQFKLLASFSDFAKKANTWSRLSRKGHRAKQIADSAFQLIARGNFTNSISYYNRADVAWQELKHIDARVSTLIYRSFARAEIGDMELAEQDIRKAHVLSLETGDRSLQSRALMVWGTLEDRRVNFKEAIEKYQMAQSLANADNNSRLGLNIAGNLATTQEKLGEISQAKDTYLKLLSADTLMEDRERNVTYYKLAELCRNAGQYEDAQKFYDQTSQLARSRNDPYFEALALSGIGSMYLNQDRYEDALKLEQASIEAFRRAGQKRNEIAGQIRIARTNTFIGKCDEGLRMAQEALSQAQEIPANDLVILAKNAIAQNYKSQHDFDNAIKVYEETLLTARQRQQFDEMSEILISLTNCYLELKKIPSFAAEIESLIVDLKARNLSTAAYAQFAFARILALKKEFPQANKAFEEVFQAAKAIGARDLMASTHEGKGDIYKNLEEYSEAESEYIQASEICEQIAIGLRVGNNRASYYDQIRRITEKQISLAYDQKQYPKVFELAERAKTRAFLGLLSQREFIGKNNPDSTLIAKERSLRENVTRLNSLLDERLPKVTNGIRSPASEKLSKELESASRDYSKFLSELELNNPRISSVVSAPTVRSEDVWALIPNHSLLLQYVVLDERLLICALMPQNQLRVFAVPYSRQTLRDDVNQLREQMQKERLKQTSWRIMASHLRHVLLDSVEAAGLLTGTEKLIILPDDVLHYLPFQMLVVNQGFLAERFAVVNYPSASVMKLLVAQKALTSRETVLAMAYSDGSIPFAEAEVKTIKNIVGSHAFTLIGKTATKDSLFELANKYSVIHLAAHGIPSAHDPMLFAIQLAPTNSDDGKLFVHEVFNLNLRNAMVVLSGCETGVEKRFQRGISAGGEVIGLVRAFLFAGASSVVSTLWKVDDEASAEFMRMFYEELQRTPAADACLQKVQQKMIASSRFNHPYFWASYISTGW